MASGGNFSLPHARNAKHLCSNSHSANQSHGEPCESLEPPCTLTSNNLDIHTSSSEVRLSKKQRNKNKTKAPLSLDSPVSSEFSPRRTCQQRPPVTAFKFSPVSHNNEDVCNTSQWLDFSDYGDADSDTEESSAQKLQLRHRKGVGLSNGTKVKRVFKHSPNRVVKKDNTNQLPNASVIMERLTYLQDCISHVTTIMQNLEKSDEPCTREQMGSLDEMLGQLRHEEQEHVELLQQVLVARDKKCIKRDQNVSQPSVSYLTDNGTCSPVKFEQEDVKTGTSEEDVQPDSRFIKEILESREKLSAIKEQQAALLNLQKRAEHRLAEAKSFHARIMDTSLPGDWNCTEMQNGDLSKQGDHEGEESDSESELSDVSEPPSRKENGSEGRSNSILAMDVENLQQRLRFLKEVADNQKLAEVMTSAEENITRDERAAEIHRQQLENKLRKLHEKKQQMDHLLAEISSLQTFSEQNGKARNQSKNREQAGHKSETNSSIPDAQSILGAAEAQENLNKLDDRKETFKQLKEMAGNLNVENGSSKQCSVAVQETQRRPRLQNQKPKDKAPSRKQGSLKSDNIKKENLFASFPARRHYEAEGRANEDGDAAQAAAAGPAVQNDADIQEKVQKLQATKSKLQKLQALLGTMQQLQQSGQSVPNELLGILSSMKEDTDSEEGNATVSAALRNSDNNDRYQTDMARLEEVEEKMIQQQVDLQKLVEERGRLLFMKEQLMQLQQQFPGVVSKNNHQRSSGEGGSIARKEKHPQQKNLLSNRDAKEASTRLDPNLFLSPDDSNSNVGQMPSRAQKDTNSRTPNQLSNHLNLPRSRSNTYVRSPDQQQQQLHESGVLTELTDKLDQNLSLRDELQKQKTVLEELLRQERKKQFGFSLNQDVRSRSSSSDKSELLERNSSVLAADTTVAATWGGSSTQDYINDELEPLESLDEDENQDSGSADDLTESKLRSFERGSDNVEFQAGVLSSGERNCRLGGTLNYNRSMLNLWRKNIQPDSSHNSEEQVLFDTPNQEAVPVLEPNISEFPTNDVSGMSKHLQQQLEQTNLLCQSILRDQHNLTSILNSHARSNQISNQPDLLRHYNYQLCQKQQLLFNLSQCYQLLYLQQIEIQHLQQCLPQNPDSENAEIHPSIANNQLAVNEELNYRHWYLPSWLNPVPLATTPAISSPYHPPFSFGTAHTSSNPVTFTSNPCTSSSTVPTSNQEARTVSETLNNQVPPGTRANNFLDNFRSYSRQNLLSTTPKSNEQLGNSATAASSVPLRLSRLPMSLRGNSRLRSHTHAPTTASQSQHASSRSSTTNVAVPNGGAKPRIKRPNLSQDQVTECTPAERARRVPASLNLLEMVEPSAHLSHSRCPPIPANSSHHFPSNASVPGHQNHVLRPLDIDPGTEQHESVSGEIRTLIQKQESNTDFLVELFKHLQLMSSDGQRNKLLTAVKEITGKSSEDVSQNSKKTECRAKSQSVYPLPEQLSQKLDADRAIHLVETVGSPNSRQDDQSPVESSSSSTSWTTTGNTHKKVAGSKQHVSLGCQQYTSVPNLQDLDLSAFLEMHREEECSVQLQAQLCNYILQTVPQQHWHFFRIHLLQGLRQVLSKYQGQRISDCENEVLAAVEEVIKTELSIHKHMNRQRRERSAESEKNDVGIRSTDSVTSGFSERDGNLKDSKTPRSEDNVEADNINGCGYLNENVPETLKAVSRKAYLELQPVHLDDVRAAPDGIAAAPPPPPALSLPLSPRFVEEESGYDCDAEGETEPEVEAETEVDDTQDLAEADQSAGQRSERNCMRENAVGAVAASHVKIVSSPVDGVEPVARQFMVNGNENFVDGTDAVADFVLEQASAAEGDGDEQMLDNIPTKLRPLSEDEQQRHYTEENAPNSMLQDIFAENNVNSVAELFGDEDSGRQPSALQ